MTDTQPMNHHDSTENQIDDAAVKLGNKKAPPAFPAVDTAKI